MTVTAAELSNESRAYLVKGWLERASQEQILDKFAQPYVIPTNATKYAEFRRFEALDNSVKELQEGVTPSGTKPVITPVKCELKQYGDYIPFSDVLDLTHENNIVQQFNEALAQQGGEMMERTRYDVLKSCSNRFYGGAATSRGATTGKYDLTLQRRIVRALDRQKTKELTKIIKAGPNIATVPVAKSYVCIVHSDLEPDLRAIAGFIPVEQYAGITPFETEIGKIERVRFLRATLCEPYKDAGGAAGGTLISSSGTSADIYPMVFLGENAFGTVSLSGFNAVDILISNPRPQAGDPLAQRGSAGWKSFGATVILNDAWMAVAEVAASA